MLSPVERTAADGGRNAAVGSDARTVFASPRYAAVRAAECVLQSGFDGLADRFRR